jgi:phage-related protein
LDGADRGRSARISPPPSSAGRSECRSAARSARGLYEIRSDISHRRITRVIFCVTEEQMVLLHGFIKKTQKTPKADLALALKRKTELTR